MKLSLLIDMTKKTLKHSIVSLASHCSLFMSNFNLTRIFIVREMRDHLCEETNVSPV